MKGGSFGDKVWEIFLCARKIKGELFELAMIASFLTHPFLIKRQKSSHLHSSVQLAVQF
jgi:hypothetical protein